MKREVDAMAKVEVYSGALCPYCSRAKALLRNKGADFTEIDVTFNRERKQAMIQRAKWPAHRAADLHRRSSYRRVRRSLRA